MLQGGIVLSTLAENGEYLAISLLRVVGLIAIFIGSWILAYGVGQVLAVSGVLSCDTKKECEMTAGMIIMPLGGIGLYFLFLVIWSFAAWRHQGKV